jgi:DNA-binding response OmpR family regulator
LRCVFAGSTWDLQTVGTLAEARRWLDQNSAPVVLCESQLPDGDWKDVFRLPAVTAHHPSVVITSRFADDKLWVEVLNLGGYDVLASPAKPGEIFRTVNAAWRTWKARSDGTNPPARAGAAAG